jgi:cyclopropane fatty-acyl-phospholipid synthase-like methyltransferase
LIRNIINKSRNIIFPGSTAYWENSYRKSGNSGTGSYEKNATYKADVLIQFVKENDINSVIEFGCGDGNQARQFDFPSYIGLDVSPTAIEKCGEVCKDDPSKQFFISDKTTTRLKAELAISLDVIYHLVEDEVYENYMRQLFATATKYVIIYAWDVEEEKKFHVRHRKFTKWIEKEINDFQLIERVSKDSYCDFFVYKKNYSC